MRTRWRNLFCFLVLAPLGSVATSLSYHGWRWKDWFNAPIIGLLCATGIALAALLTDTRKRWPAGIAIVCLAPIVQSLYYLIRVMDSTFVRYELREVLFFTGVAGALITAIHILVAPPLAVPDDRLPRARST
ncbi:MAG TPA: hypothetical protein VFK02_19645 [Kofleriaceae bacterium]|nr:hypothetical protein [Kofleriaceae bacterium]